MLLQNLAYRHQAVSSFVKNNDEADERKIAIEMVDASRKCFMVLFFVKVGVGKTRIGIQIPKILRVHLPL
jgi:hypothetical protein